MPKTGGFGPFPPLPDGVGCIFFSIGSAEFPLVGRPSSISFFPPPERDGKQRGRKARGCRFFASSLSVLSVRRVFLVPFILVSDGAEEVSPGR